MVMEVKVETRELEKAFKDIHRRLPAVTSRAINEVATFARTKANKEAAKLTRIPLKLIRKRYTINGEPKEDRTRILKSNRLTLTASLFVYVRGIPVGQIANKPTRRQNKRPGVKAKGGRLYRGAFYAPGAAPHGYVFKRRPSGQLMMPKLGIRRLFTELYGKYATGRIGIAEFQKRWNRLAEYELSKVTNKG